MGIQKEERIIGWGAPIAIGLALVAIFMIVVAILYGTHLIHDWHTETFDDVTVKVCSKCGEIKEVPPPECKHIWSVRQEGDEFIAFCTNCDETKVAD